MSRQVARSLLNIRWTSDPVKSELGGDRVKNNESDQKGIAKSIHEAVYERVKKKLADEARERAKQECTVISPDALPEVSIDDVETPEAATHGRGEWWYPKSLETYDPSHPFRRLLSASERDLFDILTALVYKTEKKNKKGSWIIRCAAEWLSRQCGGNPAPRTCEKHLKKYRDLGLIALKHPDRVNGNTYFVSSLLMQTERAEKFHYHEFAKRLADQFRARQAPPRQPQVRKTNKPPKSIPLSRDEQLELMRQPAAM